MVRAGGSRPHPDDITNARARGDEGESDCSDAPRVFNLPVGEGAERRRGEKAGQLVARGCFSRHAG